MDNLIRRSMHEAVDNFEPSASVREALLARASETVGQSLAVGSTMPPLEVGLQEGVVASKPQFTFPPTITVGHGQWLLLTAAPLYAVR